jgi:catechol 2,3-dioxygenase-like lactoylglutathione lyase family enzyme
MILNHLDLQVSDVQAAVLFFERFFDFSLVTSRSSPAIAVLRGDGDFSLVLQRKKRADEGYPEGFHCGFLVDDVATVERMHARLRGGGLTVSDIQQNNRGTMIYCHGPDGILVEVSCRRR